MKVEDTQQYNFEIDKITTCYNAQVGGLKKELDTIAKIKSNNPKIINRVLLN